MHESTRLSLLAFYEYEFNKFQVGCRLPCGQAAERDTTPEQSMISQLEEQLTTSETMRRLRIARQCLRRCGEMYR